MDQNKKIIELKGISKSFDGKPVLDDIGDLPDDGVPF